MTIMKGKTKVLVFSTQNVAVCVLFILTNTCKQFADKNYVKTQWRLKVPNN